MADSSEARPLHIGLYSPAWPPGETANGIVTYVRVLRDEFRRRGHRVSLFCGTCEANESDGIFRVVEPRRRVRWAAVRRRLGLGPAPLYGFGRAIADTVLRRHAVDPLDVFEMEESFGWCAAVATSLPLPTVVKLHGPAFLSLIDAEVQSPERRQRVRREGRALRAARPLVAPSRSTLLATAERYSLDTDALIRIANPIPPVTEDLVWQSRPEQSDEILFVGRFDYRKGGDAVLQAFARVAASRPAARLTFVGPDTGLSVAAGVVQHFAEYAHARLVPDVAARVRFLGSRPAHEIQQLRLRAGVIVTTTRWESFGYVVAEAMNQGCPIVAFDVDGVNELIVHGESGLLAPLDDIDALAASIVRLLDAPALAARLGSRARAAVSASCGVEKVADQMLAVYRGARDPTNPHRGRRC